MSNNIPHIANITPYDLEYDAKLDCNCDCKCEGSFWDFGRYRPRVIAKNLVEFCMIGLSVLQLVFGAVYINHDLYSNVYNIHF